MVSCLNPTEAWMDMDSLTKNYKHPVIFSYKEVVGLAGNAALWDENGSWINQRFRPVSIRCGKCILCRRARAQEIGVRAILEMKGYPAEIEHSFITLTVDDAHLDEVFPHDPNPLLDLPPHPLDHRPFQLFMKRLRKAGHDVRYLMCGEYGERTHRPHYHVILFGWFPHDSYFDDRGCYHGSRQLEQLWPYGHVMVDPVNANRVFYVAGYTLKDSDSRFPSYVRWSRRPGLGASYIDKFGWNRMVQEDVDWFRHEKFKSWFYRTFSGRSEIRFSSRYMDGRLELTSPGRFAKLYSARQGRILVERQKLEGSPELRALSLKVLKNRADQLKYQLARRTRELNPVVV